MEFIFEEVHLVTAGVGVDQEVSRSRSDGKGEPSIAKDVLVQAAMARQISSDRFCGDRRRRCRNQDGIDQKFGANQVSQALKLEPSTKTTWASGLTAFTRNIRKTEIAA